MTSPKTFRQRGDASEGLTPVLIPANARLRRLSVSRIRLESSSGAFEHTTGEREAVLHVLIGSCTVEVTGSWGRRVLSDLGERRDVFSGCPTSLVIAPGSQYAITPLTPTLDIALAEAVPASSDERPPTVIRPQDVRVHDIGEGHYQRTVREVLGGGGATSILRVGETINPVGKWSSWPHHEFAADPTIAPDFEEVFLYFTKPKSGWALQRRDGIFCDGEAVDDVLVVHNGDAALMPLGDHPLVSGVDSSVLYVWFYISPIAKRYAKWAEDIGGYA